MMSKRVSAIIWLGVALALAAFAPTLALAEGAGEDPTKGFGAWLIGALFEAGTLTAPPDEPGLIGTVTRPIGLMAMLVASVIIIVKSVQHLVVVAQAKNPEASPVSMTWAPLHIVFAIMLIFPSPWSGYSVGQMGAIWVGNQSNTLANLSMLNLTDFFETNGQVTPVPAPGMKPAVDTAVRSQLCQSMIEQSGEFIAGNGGTPPSVTSDVIAGGNTQTNAFAPSGNPDEYNTSTVAHRLDQEGSGYMLPTSEGEPFCGGLTVTFRNVYQSDEGEDTGTDDPGGATGYGDFGEAIQGMNSSDDQQDTMDDVTGGHEDASQIITDMAESHRGPESIAQNLLFDVERHLEVLDENDPEELEQFSEMIESEERQYIDKAAEQTVQLYKDATRDVSSVYAQALTQQREDEGRDWIENIETVGWPAVGLYAMQYTAVNDRIEDAIDVQVAPVQPTIASSEVAQTMVGDEALSRRLENRMELYNKLVNQKLKSDPLTSNLADNGMDAQDKSEMRFNHKMDSFKEDMIGELENSGGEYEADDWVLSNFFDSIVRDYVFPVMVGSLQTNDNVLLGLVNTGHIIVSVGEVAYFGSVFLRAIDETYDHTDKESLTEKGWRMAKNALGTGGTSAALDAASAGTMSVADSVISNVFGNAIFIAVKDVLGYASLLVLPGMFLAFYLPAVIMIQWVTQIVIWLIYLAEAVIVIPVWGVLFVGEMGSQAFAPQRAQQGFLHLLSILLYPSLMIVGFMVMLKVVDLISGFLIDFLMVGFVQATDGYMFGMGSAVAGLVIIGMSTYQILMRIFSGMMELNQRLMSWIGGPTQGFNEAGTEHSSRGGFIGFLQRGEQAGGQQRKKSQAERDKAAQ